MAVPTVSAKNPLALVSFIVSLIFPVLVIIRFLMIIPSLRFLSIVDGIFGGLQIPAILAAIITGHIALIQSKSSRGFAIFGLVVGYLSLAFGLFVFIIFLLGHH